MFLMTFRTIRDEQLSSLIKLGENILILHSPNTSGDHFWSFSAIWDFKMLRRYLLGFYDMTGYHYPPSGLFWGQIFTVNHLEYDFLELLYFCVLCIIAFIFLLLRQQGVKYVNRDLVRCTMSVRFFYSNSNIFFPQKNFLIK